MPHLLGVILREFHKLTDGQNVEAIRWWKKPFWHTAGHYL